MLIGILNALGVRALQIAIQLVGFLVVFGLLSKFLWKPILGLMDQREKEVNDMYADAENAKREGEKMVSDYKAKLAKSEEEAQAKLAETINAGNAQAEKIVEEARSQAESEKERALNSIQDEAKKARMELRDFTATLSIDIAGKILDEEVDKAKHEALVKKFLTELESMN